MGGCGMFAPVSRTLTMRLALNGRAGALPPIGSNGTTQCVSGVVESRGKRPSVHNKWPQILRKPNLCRTGFTRFRSYGLTQAVFRRVSGFTGGIIYGVSFRPPWRLAELANPP